MFASSARTCVLRIPKSFSGRGRLQVIYADNLAIRESRCYVQFHDIEPIGRRLLSSGRPAGAKKPSLSGINPETQHGQTFLQRWLGPKEMPPRGTLRWYAEMVLVCTVFAITGSSTMVLVRPAVSDILGLKGSLKDGPWDYRICSLVIMTPLYASLLVAVGTIFGRHAYFRHFSVKIFSRFGIPPELMDKNFHESAKTFRKW